MYLDTVLGWRDGARKVDILNLSFGANGIIDNYTEQQLRQNFDSAIAAMAQAGVDEKTILVWGAGNAHGQGASFCEPPSPDCNSEGIDAVSVEVFPGLAARIAELRGHTVAVVALREDDGRIASFSNRCGIAAAYCIAAPGKTWRTRISDPIRKRARWIAATPPTEAERPWPRPWWRAGLR